MSRTKAKPLAIVSRAHAERIPKAEEMIVPAAILMAAASVVAPADDDRVVLRGVHLHRKDDMARVVATDGVRMFISAFKCGADMPAWLDSEGVTLSATGLKARVAMIVKIQKNPVVTLSFARGQPRATLSDQQSEAVFQVPVIAEAYPDYEATLSASSFVNLDDIGERAGTEWEPVGINSAYLKQIGEIARTLEAAMAKEDRTPGGMIIRSYTGGSPDSPLVFDFSTWPGTILVIMSYKLATPAASKETAVLLAPAVRGTIAALRAHATRWRVTYENATGDYEKEAALEKMRGFEQRVAEVLRRAPGLPAISDQSEPEQEPEQQPVEEVAA
jgi:hypothetical protein